jgi:hypothetical protein
MQINLIGLAAAAATFLGVWLGHVSVRRIEREVEQLWIPSALAFALGLALEFSSYQADSLILSTFCGILGMTLLWDSFELFRQQKRIRHGHAPANPNNPRHARILAAYPSATTIDWLDRDPRGVPFSTEEQRKIEGE